MVSFRSAYALAACSVANKQEVKRKNKNKNKSKRRHTRKHEENVSKSLGFLADVYRNVHLVIPDMSDSGNCRAQQPTSDSSP